MYHVGSTKRSRDSAELIYYGIAICAQQQPLEAITVSEIQRITGVARTTFYRSFDSVQDVLEWKCDQYYLGFLAQLPAAVRDKQSLQELYIATLEYVEQNPELPLFLMSQEKIMMLLSRYQDLIPYFEEGAKSLSPYSVLLSWVSPILMILCKAQYELTDSSKEIVAKLQQDLRSTTHPLK